MGFGGKRLRADWMHLAVFKFNFQCLIAHSDTAKE